VPPWKPPSSASSAGEYCTFQPSVSPAVLARRVQRLRERVGTKASQMIREGEAVVGAGGVTSQGSPRLAIAAKLNNAEAQSSLAKRGMAREW
jgi:hypothetical protein